MSHHVTDDGKREIGQVLPFDLVLLLVLTNAVQIR